MLVVILDDFQRAESDGVCNLLRTFDSPVYRRPFTSSSSSRGTAQISATQSFAADHDLLEIGASDLRFSLEEADNRIQECGGRPFDT